MASIIENLITTLQKENEEYRTLLALSMEKTGIIVKGDPDALTAMVEKEQEVVGRINALEKKRMEATKDIGVVLNKRPQDLKLGAIIALMKNQPKECEALKNVHDALKETMAQMTRVNDNNKALLQESIDMVQFEMNLLQSLKQGPSNTNYSGADYADNGYGPVGSFDAKQ